MKERTVYREGYKKGTAVRRDRLPTLKHSNGMQPTEMHLLAAGIVERDGERLEYQDVRLYFAALASQAEEK